MSCARKKNNMVNPIFGFTIIGQIDKAVPVRNYSLIQHWKIRFFYNLKDFEIFGVEHLKVGYI